jgi:hypothetical protein
MKKYEQRGRCSEGDAGDALCECSMHTAGKGVARRIDVDEGGWVRELNDGAKAAREASTQSIPQSRLVSSRLVSCSVVYCTRFWRGLRA